MRILSLFLTLTMLWSCAAPAEPTPSPAEPTPPVETEAPVGLTADGLAQAVLASQPDGEGYIGRVTGAQREELDFYLAVYGVDLYVAGDAAIYTGEGVDAREVAILSLDRGTYAYDETSTVAALENYIQDRHADFFGYEPDQAALVETGQVAVGGHWIALLICSDMPAAKEAFQALAGPSAQTDLPTYAPDARYVKDERGYLPFLPPNEVDMTAYDTAAIRRAYATGEEGALSKKDAAILQKCRAVLGACITDGMTDFEKELALHDWMMENGQYDRTSLASPILEGQPHNRDPYGFLVGGYGICLGYATTFQLLMDLAGVECITVVGAGSWSREDHAWNMVKLEGEWYCVDPTWDDATLTDPAAFTAEELSLRYHKYFNVTSDEMRETNHQWDYDSVPEATATRYRWDGTGAPPV